MAGRASHAEVRAQMETTDPIIQQLRAARLTAGYSQEELAHMLGREKHAQFSVLERGLREPHLSTLRTWAAVLGFDIVLVPREGADG